MSCLYTFKCPHGNTLNFLHQCEICAKDHLAKRAETIRTQQATIDRLTEQLKKLNDSLTSCIDLTPDLLRETSALIAEIEAGK